MSGWKDKEPRAEPHRLGRSWTAQPILIGPFLMLLLWNGSTASQVAPAARAGSHAPADWSQGGEASNPWLDAVRAQRRAWEARRDAAREELTARRRLHNPRGSARQEAWEDDLRQRRAERQERIDQERELFREFGSQPPAAEPPGPAGLQDGTKGLLFAPPGWNNLWYFRGF